MKNVYTFTVDFRRPCVGKLHGLVAGDNGNQFVVGVYNDGEFVELPVDQHPKVEAVFVRSDGQEIVHASDDTSPTVTIENNYLITIDVQSSDYKSGENEFYLRVYTQPSGQTAYTKQTTTRKLFYARS